MMWIINMFGCCWSLKRSFVDADDVYFVSVGICDRVKLFHGLRFEQSLEPHIASLMTCWLWEILAMSWI